MNTTLVLTSSSRGSSSSASPDKKKDKTKLMFPCPYCMKHYVDVRAHIHRKHSEHYKTKSARERVPTTDMWGNVSWNELKPEPKKTGIVIYEYCMKHFASVSSRNKHIKQVHHIVSSKSNPAENGDHPNERGRRWVEPDVQKRQ